VSRRTVYTSIIVGKYVYLIMVVYIELVAIPEHRLAATCEN